MRADYVFGAIDAALTTGTTTLSSPTLARLPVVASPDVAAITLYDSTALVYEVVWVTAHAAGATTATITRAQESSTARAWASGVTWTHAPTAYDLALVTPGTFRRPVQDVSTGTPGAQISGATLTIAAPVTGNYLVVGWASESAQRITSVTGGGATWTRLVETAVGTAPRAELWGGLVGASPTTTVTITADSAAFAGASLVELPGLTGTVHASAVVSNVANRYVPAPVVTNPAAMIVTLAAQSGFTGAYNGLSSPHLLWLPASNGSVAFAIGAPGTQAVVGAWTNIHPASSSGASVALL